MHQVRRTAFFTGVPSLFEAPSGIRFAVILTGKHESDIVAFVAKRHSFGEGILARDPTDVYAQSFINPRACDVEGFVAEGFHHARELRLRPHAWHFCDQSYYPRHTLSFRWLPPMTTANLGCTTLCAGRGT